MILEGLVEKLGKIETLEIVTKFFEYLKKHALKSQKVTTSELLWSNFLPFSCKVLLLDKLHQTFKFMSTVL